MKINSLKISNHQSIGNIEIDVMPTGLIHITGQEQGGDANRSGKTAFIEALTKSLFGTCPRGSGKVTGYVEGSFEIAGKNIESRVSWSAAGAHKWKLSIDGEQFAGMKECLAQMETTIGLTYDEFVKMNFLQKSCDNLTKSDPSERADMAIKFLGIREHDQSISMAQQNLAWTSDQIEKLRRELDIANAIEIPDQNIIKALENELKELRGSLKPLTDKENELAESIVQDQSAIKKIDERLISERKRETIVIDSNARISAIIENISRTASRISNATPIPVFSNFINPMDNSSMSGMVAAIENQQPLFTGLRNRQTIIDDISQTRSQIEGIRVSIAEFNYIINDINRIIGLKKRADVLENDIPKTVQASIDELPELQKRLSAVEMDQIKEQKTLAELRNMANKETIEFAALERKISNLVNTTSASEKKLEQLRGKDGVDCPLSGSPCPVIPVDEIKHMIDIESKTLQDSQLALSGAEKLKSAAVSEIADYTSDIADSENIGKKLAEELSVINTKIRTISAMQANLGAWQEAKTSFLGAVEKFGEAHSDIVPDQSGIDDATASCEKAVEQLTKFEADINRLNAELDTITCVASITESCMAVVPLHQAIIENNDAFGKIESIRISREIIQNKLDSDTERIGSVRIEKASIIERGKAMKDRLDGMIAMTEKVAAKDKLIADIDRLTTRKGLLVETIRFYQLLPIYEFGNKLAGLEDMANHYRSILTDKFVIRFKPVKEYKTSGNVKFQWTIMLEDGLGERLIDHKHPEASGAELDVINFSIKSALMEMFSAMTGKRPGIMLMDEPFTSYSDQKVDAFLGYLTSTMAARYNQIFLVAHDPRVKDTLENAATISLYRSDGAGSGIGK